MQEKRGNQGKEKLEKLKSQTNETKDKYAEETRLALDSFLANMQAKCMWRRTQVSFIIVYVESLLFFGHYNDCGFCWSAEP